MNYTIDNVKDELKLISTDTIHIIERCLKKDDTYPELWLLLSVWYENCELPVVTTKIDMSMSQSHDLIYTVIDLYYDTYDSDVVFGIDRIYRDEFPNI